MCSLAALTLCALCGGVFGALLCALLRRPASGAERGASDYWRELVERRWSGWVERDELSERWDGLERRLERELLEAAEREASMRSRIRRMRGLWCGKADCPLRERCAAVGPDEEEEGTKTKD